jgi:hypothetical protein
MNKNIFSKATLAVATCASVLIFAAPADSVSQVLYSGAVSAVLYLSSGGLGGQGIYVSGPDTGAHVMIGSGAGADLIDLVDFGELARGTGEPEVATIGLRIRGNSSYKLNISNFNFRATALKVHKREINSASDTGSFIEVKAGTPVATGRLGNAGATMIGAIMQTGTSLSGITQGNVSAQSTVVCTGPAPSLGGTINNPDNAVDIPVYFYVPTGMAIGPSREAAKGQFQVSVQVGIFPGN